MRNTALLLAMLLLWGGPSLSWTALAGEGESIHYDRPQEYATVSPQMADGARLASLAGQLRAQDPRRSLGQAARWVLRNVPQRSGATPAFRTFDEVVRDRFHVGAADLSVLIGVFARAMGVPTVWVKAVDLGDLRAALLGTTQVKDIGYAVFLEVFFEGQWRLLEPVSMQIWDGYDPAQRVLPQGHFVLEKGSDPATLALPGTGPQYLERLRKQVGALNVRQLPWGASQDLLAPWRVYIAGAGFSATYAKEACRATGFLAQEVFNGDWEGSLARARGSTLMVMSDEASRPVLPERYWAAWLPPGAAAIANGGPSPATGFLSHRLADGTRVIWVCAKDTTEAEAAAAAALEQ